MESAFANSFATFSALDRVAGVTIVINDNGPGISRAAKKNLFKPFYTTKQEGAGLGRYITKRIVEKCGGEIFFETPRQGGAGFRLFFKVDPA